MFNLNAFNQEVTPMPALATHLVEYTYLAYLALALPVTVYVAWTLHRNGRAFLVDAFQGDDALADSVNHLLVVGFYLVNVGWIVMTLRTHLSIVTARAAMELLAEKVGTVLFVLGVMHLFNVYLFSQYRRRALDRRAAGLGDTSFLTPREEGR